MHVLDRLGKALDMIRLAIRRHGGGWDGTRSVLLRTIRVTLALGPRGLLRRLQSAHRRDTAILNPVPADNVFLEAAPIDQVQLSIGIMAHVYYADLIDEFADEFARMPCPYTLLISVVDEATYAQAQARFSTLPRLHALHIRVVPNRGRDIAPLLVSFADELRALQVLCHVHTKKSLYTGNEQIGWREYLLQSLFGSSERIAWILGSFQAMPSLGMVYPESYPSVPLGAHTWLSNADIGQQLAQRMGLQIDHTAYIDFPAGSMFWARVEALAPLLDLKLKLSDFPEEKGQIEGTLQHAIERMFGFATRQCGMLIGILPSDGRQVLYSEGERNRQLHFNAPLQDKVDYFAIGARMVSFDLFDTLVLRPFLTPAGSRAYLAYKAKQRHAIDHFFSMRQEAETTARSRLRRDPCLGEIYATMADAGMISPQQALQLQQLELDHERVQLQARSASLQAMQAIVKSGRRVIAVSDMYLDNTMLREVLPAEVHEPLAHIYASCETGHRKDDPTTWDWLAQQEQIKVTQWLHVGDNENSDVHLPMDAGLIEPVHVLRPDTLLTVVPALRGLRPNQGQLARWEDQLWLGLLANHFTELSDREPESLRDSLRLQAPESLGYAVLGPLLLDYLTWLARLALEQRSSKLLFLAREGYLLERVYQRLRETCPALAPLQGIYLLASRRAVNTPSLRNLDDLADVFSSPYTGSLNSLLQARLGEAVTTAVLEALGAQTMQQEVYLPDMQATLIEWLRPAETAILTAADQERTSYLAYWHRQVQSADAPIVADLGYAGSIQKQLSKLVNQPLGGAYFAAKPGMAQITHGHGWAQARYVDQRTSVESSPVLDQHLLLETLLTAPAGQFSHFSADGEAQFRPRDSTHWTTIESIQNGALAFVDAALATVGSDALALSFDTELVQQPLHAVASHSWQLGDWAHSLAVDDPYTGRNQISTHPCA